MILSDIFETLFIHFKGLLYHFYLSSPCSSTSSHCLPIFYFVQSLCMYLVHRTLLIGMKLYVAISFKSSVLLARAGEAPWFVVAVLLFHVQSPPWFGVCKNGSVVAMLWYAPRRSRNQQESKRAGPKKMHTPIVWHHLD
jgi:hypothetical protein